MNWVLGGWEWAHMLGKKHNTGLLELKTEHVKAELTARKQTFMGVGVNVGAGSRPPFPPSFCPVVFASSLIPIVSTIWY